MLLNPIFKMTTCVANVTRIASNTSKFVLQEIFQIARNMIFIWNIIFNFERSKN